MWELRLNRDGFSIQAALEKGRDLPEWYLEEPELWPGDHFYLKAFWRLSTCRSIGFSPGRIPWYAVDDYGHRHGLDDDTMDLFETVISAMDTSYLDWSAEQKPTGEQQGGMGKGKGR